MTEPFHDIARLPVPSDNAAISLVDLKAGTTVEAGSTRFDLKHDVLTGHRFAITAIPKGSYITSWAYPFGTACRDIAKGEYLCNANVLYRLSIQEAVQFTDLELPDQANFVDDIEPFTFDESTWKKPPPVRLYETPRTFLGYKRSKRGVGTRNHFVIVNTCATTAPLVERLEAIYKDKASAYKNVDAIIGLRHTENSSIHAEENERTLRTLAGLISNANVGGFIAIDSGLEGDLSNNDLIRWMNENGLPVDDMPYELLSASDSFEADVATIAPSIDRMLEKLNLDLRSEQSIAHLKIGLQCGASDAFSGICGNILSAAIGREVIRHGGVANLTETPELSGAEDYILTRITRPEIAQTFLRMMDRFKTHLDWHGGRIDKNPSEGNLLGGLYNITLKSLGAAVKRDPQIPIQEIIEYGERMTQPGLHFMDGMGGDIASYTGQAASGCNIILFVTGRGSPTSSSIVPTIKIVNTTPRYRMMQGDIDINAGEYLDGKPMEQLTEEVLQQVIDIASGVHTSGEAHQQNIDLLWRRKFFHNKPESAQEFTPSRFDGQPQACSAPEGPPLQLGFAGRKTSCGIVPHERIALLIPTVGCSLATAQQAAEQLNQSQWIESGRISRFVVLNNTEGCGVTTGAEVLNFLISYATHPLVDACLFLSLGCEMVSPSFIKSTMRGEDIGFPEITHVTEAKGIDPEQFGWIAIQETGGTEHAVSAVQAWFEKRLKSSPIIVPAEGTAAHMRIGLMTSPKLPIEAIDAALEFTRQVVANGGSVVIPDDSSALLSAKLCDSVPVKPTLSFAQAIDRPGLHLMQRINDNSIEQVTGLGATTDLIIHIGKNRPIPAHTLTPTLNITASEIRGDFDQQLQSDSKDNWPQQIADLAREVLSGRYQPRQNSLGNTGNQIPRGTRAHAI